MTTPSEKMSLRASVGMYWACSGDMYCALPIRTWPSWSFMRLRALAMPKSVILHSPSAEIMRFLGEMSRWTTPSGLPDLSRFAWAYSRPRQMREMTNAPRSIGTLVPSSRWRFMNSWRLMPWTYSMAM